MSSPEGQSTKALSHKVTRCGVANDVPQIKLLSRSKEKYEYPMMPRHQPVNNRPPDPEVIPDDRHQKMKVYATRSRDCSKRPRISHMKSHSQSRDTPSSRCTKQSSGPSSNDQQKAEVRLLKQINSHNGQMVDHDNLRRYAFSQVNHDFDRQ